MENSYSNMNVDSNEESRLLSLYDLNILDTPSTINLDRITHLCALVFNVPIASVSLVDKTRVWTKSNYGDNPLEIERIDGLCSSAIKGEDVYVINDTLNDPRTTYHPQVRNERGIRFYAGAPLKSPDGFIIGTLCLMDFVPRKLTKIKLKILQDLSKIVEDELSIDFKQNKLNRINNKLIKSGSYYLSIFEKAELGFAISSIKTDFVIASNKVLQDLLFDNDICPSKWKISNFLSHEYLLQYQSNLRKLADGDHLFFTNEILVKKIDGQHLWFNLTCIANLDDSNEPDEYISIFQNITKQKHFEGALLQNNERWNFAIEGSHIGIWDLNLRTNKINLSPQCLRMLDYSKNQISTDMNEWVKLIHPNDLPCLVAARTQAINGDIKGFENEHRKLDAHGNWKWIQVKGVVAERDSNGEPLRLVGTYTDISERKKAEDNILRLAHYDVITGLPNRLLFSDRLNQQIKNSIRNNQSFALLMLDLDNFKKVNDKFGHHKGDMLLEKVARRLEDSVRSNDTVARLSGDEFAIILSNANSMVDIESISTKILGEIFIPFDLDGDLLTISTSIGIALFPTDAVESDELLKSADFAMYSAKKTGRNKYAFANPSNLD